ncbi:Permease of the drug/metabolite transporter (DMT) superfamily [Paenibacillus pasadenensis]|uniref:Permease of the drug/metabolite transporter (DMT) superfamily n=2 Tax=Paenibacillus TaxID=44249 RepID=A0A2N5N6M1_9BACL|nr:Permease of the drug/metabolite transporter (DMT) superfamily [Paenibacillus pasadenensis]
MENGTKMKKSEWLLLVVTLCWGSAYLLLKAAMEAVEPLMLIGLRFMIGFLIAGAILYPRLRKATRRTVALAAMQGALLFLISVTVTFALKSTSTANASFLLSLTVIFVPLLSATFLRQKLTPQLTAGIGFAIAGIGLMTLKMPLSMQPGDLLCMLAALINATYVLLTSRAAKEVDTINLGVLQLGFAGLFGLIFAGFMGQLSLPSTGGGWGAILALAVVCSAFCYIAQPAAQKFTTASRAGLIFSMEPVFAAMFGFLVVGEMLSAQGYAGAALVLTGVLVSEYGARWLQALRRRSRPQAQPEPGMLP